LSDEILTQEEFKKLCQFCIQHNLPVNLIDFTKSYLENMVVLQAKARIYR